MKLKWEAILTVALAACALITTAMVVRREFFVPATASVQAAPQKPVYIENWKSQLAQGMLLGPSNASVQLIEFADFECPYCAEFHKSLKELRKRYPTQVSLTYVHFPLVGHRFALPAARVAECAGAQGRFEAMHDQLFEEQDSFGLKAWSEYATAAGVPDLGAFDACIKQTNLFPHIEEGKTLGRELNVQATPTLILNGWKLGQPPSPQELDTMVKAVLAGKSPVAPTRKS